MKRMLAWGSPLCQPGVHHPLEQHFKQHLILIYNNLRILDERLANLWGMNLLRKPRDIELFAVIIWRRWECLQGATAIPEQVCTLRGRPRNHHVSMVFVDHNANRVQARRAILAKRGNKGVSNMWSGREQQPLPNLRQLGRFILEIAPGLHMTVVAEYSGVLLHSYFDRFIIPPLICWKIRFARFDPASRGAFDDRI